MSEFKTGYYIPCEHCGHRNPFTEFITFCDVCGRKLKHNFPEWVKAHPGKPATEFYQNFCVTDTNARAVDTGQRFPIKTLLILSIFTLIIAGGIFFIVNGPSALSNLLLPEETHVSLLKSDWQRNSYGKYGLSIESPEKLRSDKFTPPPALAMQLKDAEHFYYKPSKGFQLELIAMSFKEPYRVSLQAVVNNTARSLASRPGISNLEFNQSPVFYHELKGLLLEGAYHDNGKRIRFLCVLYTRDSNVWQAVATYRDSDETGARAAVKAIGSLQVNYFTKPV